jgi:hypothetical protein
MHHDAYMRPRSVLRFDHNTVRVGVDLEGDNVGLMPPLEALSAPVKLKMCNWKEKRSMWANNVVLALLSETLSQTVQKLDRFLELERTKRSALDCARTVIGATGENCCVSFCNTCRSRGCSGPLC